MFRSEHGDALGGLITTEPCVSCTSTEGLYLSELDAITVLLCQQMADPSRTDASTAGRTPCFAMVIRTRSCFPITTTPTTFELTPCSCSRHSSST